MTPELGAHVEDVSEHPAQSDVIEPVVEDTKPEIESDELDIDSLLSENNNVEEFEQEQPELEPSPELSSSEESAKI